MDLDGDGYLSMFELEYFYEEQVQKMESMGIETLPFNDCLCQVTQILHVTYSIVTCCMFVNWLHLNKIYKEDKE